ncbi:hypothetical protein [Chryseolinea lacunae]|uniref:Lipoprotein n=1 Tax=Chryseolinea lacunae TaxID=2801331 RepID=A0ABS1KWJ3_9BACT|nr:hypothetical protein [Chryseolinea lacunae]MBL0743678.1 hypothetical protein [Chryseolinea lacunae]
MKLRFTPTQAINIIASIALAGCGYIHPCDFEIDREFIKTSCDFSNGLEVEKIKNIREFRDDVPVAYDVEFSLWYFQKPWQKDERTVIYFKKEMKDYEWYNLTNGLTSKTMPFDFEKEQWYIFGGLYEHGAPSVLLYVYVNSDNSLRVHRVDKPTNF